MPLQLGVDGLADAVNVSGISVIVTGAEVAVVPHVVETVKFPAVDTTMD